ncbi:unnamed protein product [Cuscuta campestris]|uniref:Uncharacterized protein n=1 Tax=Cuscuta campestris TaxID=132261 RepID=A0A484K2W7_9ASTE|nr:unnamed protein product [Cuscuta campestris]
MSLANLPPTAPPRHTQSHRVAVHRPTIGTGSPFYIFLGLQMSLLFSNSSPPNQGNHRNLPDSNFFTRSSFMMEKRGVSTSRWVNSSRIHAAA